MDFLAGLHPQVVHFAISLLLVYLLLETIGAFTNKEFFSRAAHLILFLGVLSALTAVLTGHQAEDVAAQWEKHGAIIPFKAIGEHEDWANITLWFFVGVLVARTYLVLKKRFNRTFKFIFVGLALVGAFFVYQTGEHGGKLVYKYGLGTDLKKSEMKENGN